MRSGRFTKTLGRVLVIAALVTVGIRLSVTAAVWAQSIPSSGVLELDRLPTGTVTVLGETTCPRGAATGADCTSIQVSCPSLPAINATLARSGPSDNPRGTIILLASGAGISFLNDGFPDVYTADGFQVVQLAWSGDWGSPKGVGMMGAACRPATVFLYVFKTFHKRNRSIGFCGQGISGGGASLAYSLAHYGESALFDYVIIAGGPALARIDYGCDPSLYTGPPRYLCPLLPDAGFTYPKAYQFDLWEGTTTCLAPDPLPGDIDVWAADSIVGAGANYSYPKTAISWFFCATPPASGGSTGQGTFLIEQVIPKNIPADVNCYSGQCENELVWEDPSAFNTTLSDMLAQCTPNHQ